MHARLHNLLLRSTWAARSSTKGLLSELRQANKSRFIRECQLLVRRVWACWEKAVRCIPHAHHLASWRLENKKGHEDEEPANPNSQIERERQRWPATRRPTETSFLPHPHKCRPARRTPPRNVSSGTSISVCKKSNNSPPLHFSLGNGAASNHNSALKHAGSPSWRSQCRRVPGHLAKRTIMPNQVQTATAQGIIVGMQGGCTNEIATTQQEGGPQPECEICELDACIPGRPTTSANVRETTWPHKGPNESGPTAQTQCLKPSRAKGPLAREGVRAFSLPPQGGTLPTPGRCARGARK